MAEHPTAADLTGTMPDSIRWIPVWEEKLARLREIERLAREITRTWPGWIEDWHTHVEYCLWCKGDGAHAPDCLYGQLRAALASGRDGA